MTISTQLNLITAVCVYCLCLLIWFNLENKWGDANNGEALRGGWKGESHLSLSGLQLSEHLTLLSKVITTSVNLTSTSCCRNADNVYHASAPHRNATQLWAKTFLLFFFGFFFTVLPPCFTFVMDTFSHFDYANPAVHMRGSLLCDWLVTFWFRLSPYSSQQLPSEYKWECTDRWRWL